MMRKTLKKPENGKKKVFFTSREHIVKLLLI